MKTVVKTIPIVVDVLNVSTDKYYGVAEHKNLRGFITRKSGISTDFITFIIRNLTNGNGFYTASYSTLQELINNLISTYNYSVYEFDTASELFEWLSVGINETD